MTEPLEARAPFSVRAASSAWRTAAESWIRASLDAHGIAATGPVGTERRRPWSVQLTVPTGEGVVWFKANCDSMRFEPGLQELLARLVPESVERPLAVDVDRGWLLTRDHGPSLGAQGVPTVAHWQAAVREAAVLQRTLSVHGEEILATGLPDCAPATVPERFDLLLEELRDTPRGVDADTADRLAARRSQLVDACDALGESPLPTTWQHGDLHPWNLSGSLDRPRLFDFGDAQWAHAVEVLMVPFGFCTENGQASWDDLVEPYREVWGADRTTFDLAWNAVSFTHPVNRALTWHRALVGANDAELEQWGDATAQHLVRMLDA